MYTVVTPQVFSGGFGGHFFLLGVLNFFLNHRESA